MKQVILSLSLTLMSGTVLAQDEPAFYGWDADGDGAVTESEFNEGFVDADHDGTSEEGVHIGSFAYWDDNGDGVLSEEEWNEVAAEDLEVE